MIAMPLKPPPASCKPQLFLGSFVHCRTRDELEYLHNSAVFVDCRGRIAAIEPDCNLARATAEMLPRLGWLIADVHTTACRPGQFFFPGFIDTHLHASQYPNVGLFGNSSLLDWLNTYTFPLEASLADLPKASRVYRTCVRRTLAHGTTTAAYYATVDVAATNLLADICRDLGQRAFVGRVAMDRQDFCPPFYRDRDATAALAATRATIAHLLPTQPSGSSPGSSPGSCTPATPFSAALDADPPLVQPILTPRFALACSSELMHGLAALHASTGLPIQTHISENTAEIELVHQQYPAEASYAAVYDAHGLLTPRTVLAHAVHLTEAEAALIAARGAKVAHCPCSNTAIASGAARVRWLWDRGIAVGLGTDISGGYSASMLESARHACLVSRHVALAKPAADPARDRVKLSVDQVLFLATAGGADVLGLAHIAGRFAVGLDWDAQLIGLTAVRDHDDDRDDSDEHHDGNVDCFGWETWEERVAKWLFNGDDRNTRLVWVRGRLVHSRK